jgi:hypothetical protein
VGDVIGDGLSDCGELVGFRDQFPAVAGVVEETIGPLVAAHFDEAQDIDEQSRRIARQDGGVEHVDALRHFLEERLELLLQEVEPRKLGGPQFDQNARAFGGCRPRTAQRFPQTGRRCVALLFHGLG